MRQVAEKLAAHKQPFALDLAKLSADGALHGGSGWEREARARPHSRAHRARVELLLVLYEPSTAMNLRIELLNQAGVDIALAKQRGLDNLRVELATTILATGKLEAGDAGWLEPRFYVSRADRGRRVEAGYREAPRSVSPELLRWTEQGSKVLPKR